MSDDTWKPFIESINKHHAQYEEEKRKQVEDIIDFIYKNREALLKAFIAETGLLPSQIVMVQKTDYPITKIWFEKKESIENE